MTFWRSVVSTLFGYETQKVVQIQSKTVGAFFRSIQLGIILYVIFWVMIREKGYQYLDHAVSGVTAKLKGISLVNSTETKVGLAIYDAADYVIPPQQNAAFFIMTNLIMTPGQKLDLCDESIDVWKSGCKTDDDCTVGDLVMIGSGSRTGRCVPSTQKNNTKVCEIYGWCPTEYDFLPKEPLISTAKDFTVMIKNSIEFPRYGIKRRNVLKWMTKKFLVTCRYDPNHEINKYCPIFRIGDILNYTDANNTGIWKYGGMVSIHIEWNCNLDYDIENCLPKYIFRRLDESDSPVAKGWNFRFGQHFTENGVRYRNLIKAYGIQFFITVYGRGGQFNLLQFSMNMGSGLALLGIATVLCDMIALNVTRKRNFYRSAKVDMVSPIESRLHSNDTDSSSEISLHVFKKKPKGDRKGKKRHSSVVIPAKKYKKAPQSKSVSFVQTSPDPSKYSCLPKSVEESLLAMNNENRPA